MDMCRFSGPDDVEYQKVVAAIHRILEVSRAPAPLDQTTLADQYEHLLDRLRFDQIDARHETIEIAHTRTCKWLFSKSEYRDWLDNTKLSDHHGFFWVKGKPATGKSTLMKFAYAKARKASTNDNIIISFFFNARGEKLEKSALGMYRSLLYQLLEKVPHLQKLPNSPRPSVPNNFDECNIETVKNMFGRAVESLGRRSLTCFIDAL